MEIELKDNKKREKIYEVNKFMVMVDFVGRIEKLNFGEVNFEW